MIKYSREDVLINGERVDLFIGNHSRQNDTKGKAELIGKSEANPFLDSSAFSKFLDKLKIILIEL